MFNYVYIYLFIYVYTCIIYVYTKKNLYMERLENLKGLNTHTYIKMY